MIEAAEDLLGAGARPQPKVAILSPKSSEMWEAKSTPIPTRCPAHKESDEIRASLWQAFVSVSAIS